MVTGRQAYDKNTELLVSSEECVYTLLVKGVGEETLIRNLSFLFKIL